MRTNRLISLTAVAFCLATLLCLTACGTLNRGTAADPDRGPVIGDVTFTADFWGATDPATITVPWTEGTGPFTISIEVGTGESVPPGTDAGTSPFSWAFTLLEGTSFKYTVVLTDSNGYSATKTGTYGPVSGGPPPQAQIESVHFADGVLTVTVSEWTGSDVQVSVTDIPGLRVDNNWKTVQGGNGSVEFYWEAEDWFAGGSGETTIEAYEGYGWWTPTETATITIPPIELELAEGQLGVIPTQPHAAVGDEVTVAVATGPFPAGKPFNYMNGVAVGVTDGGDYVSGTFNVGAIGGEVKDKDGIWAEMDPQPATFFIPEDFMMRATDVTADSSLDFMGFNVTPIGAGEVTCGGFLFNFGMQFDAAGTYELSILEFQDVVRTYYSDSNTNVYYWTDVSNNLNVPTRIRVN